MFPSAPAPTRRCHVDDPGHALVRCAKPCDRLHQACGHACNKLCHQPCGQCPVILPEAGPLRCGHMIKNVQCWR